MQEKMSDESAGWNLTDWQCVLRVQKTQLNEGGCHKR